MSLFFDAQPELPNLLLAMVVAGIPAPQEKYNKVGRHKPTPEMAEAANKRRLANWERINGASSEETTAAIAAANILCQERYGCSLLEKAILGGHIRVVQWLLQKGVVASELLSDETPPVVLAARLGHTPIVEALHRLGADVNRLGLNGETALMWAALNGHTATVEALHRLGADMNSVDQDGRNTLMWAAYYGHTATVEAVHRLGADVNSIDQDDRPALMLAALKGHTATVEALHRLGADVNHVDLDGYTALMWAARNGHTATVEFLIMNGAEAPETQGFWDRLSVDMQGTITAAQGIRCRQLVEEVALVLPVADLPELIVSLLPTAPALGNGR